MIITVFLTIFLVAALFIFLGNWDLENNFYLAVVGYAFLFILGLGLITSGIDYKSGYNMNTSGSSTTVTAVYTSYTNQTIGVFIAIASFAAFALSIWQAKFGGGDD